MTKTKKVTPLMKQYNAIKSKHEGALLLFRVGDFYETFGEDAIKASKILDIVLTKRSAGTPSEIELAGFPHHSIDTYLPKLVRAGERVAICDQLEDPKSVKGIVKRGVTELVTPGLSYHDHVLEARKNNYLCSIHVEKHNSKQEVIGIAFLDISTGEFLTSQGNWEYIAKLLQGFQPSEIIYNKKYYSVLTGIKDPKDEQAEFFLKEVCEEFATYPIENWIYTADYAFEKLTKNFNTKSLKGFGIDKMPAAIIASGAVLYYLDLTEHKETLHIRQISRIEESKYMWLDKFTISNLELIYSQHENGVPLIKVLDQTLTPMGARLLKKWLVLPLKNKEQIEFRQEIVKFFYHNEAFLEKTNNYLLGIGDVERLNSKLATGRINPREMVRIKNALENIIPIGELLLQTGNNEIQSLAKQINPCKELLNSIAETLKDEPAVLTSQGNLIRDGFDKELDEYRYIANSGKELLDGIKVREAERTGITSLKISFNKVYGYYLEVSNTHRDKVPHEWIRKQTLVNAERYITEELKEYEDKILSAEGRIFEIEHRLFNQLIKQALEHVQAMQRNSQILARIDVLCNFAQIAIQNQYNCPQMSKDKSLVIEQGRHPVIETQLAADEAYIPNDVSLDTDNQQVMIITGPNMAGKSALLRQTALIVLMAQIGSFVPAKKAKIGWIDRIFTRVGASDNLAQGESTFMVEMSQTASIMNNLSDRSLVLMDEIGRGTSTYDGISIAWAIVEYLHKHPKFRAKTLFATHYHELNQLAEELPRVKNYNVSVKEINQKIIFLRQLQEGGSLHSFGINVAQLAGMPNLIVSRAKEIMQHFENSKVREKSQELIQEIPKQADFQMNMFEISDPNYAKIKSMIQKLDINTISPVEALLKLNEIKDILSS
jgi:DNA mismatch repair protein MutS